MKKEYLFFLVMVLCAAIITGAAIGFVSNFHQIVDQLPEESQIESSKQGAAAPAAPEPSSGVRSESIEPKETTDGNAAKKVAGVNSMTASTEKEYLVLSKEENQQVINMLVSLGATKDSDYSEFIREFQKDQELPSTGSLDSLTLNAIIREVTKQKALQMVNG